MRDMDLDGDGQINYEEFLVATADRQLVNHQNNIWWAFCEYDKDGVRRARAATTRCILRLTRSPRDDRMGRSPRRSFAA